MHRVIARFQDGRTLHGFTNDFLPAKDHFHLFSAEHPAGTKPIEIHVAELKALYFVKSFEGDPKHLEVVNSAAAKAGAGRGIRVTFKDGDIIVGKTQGYDRSRPGFFVVPVDHGSNTERCFVVTAATREVVFL
jgi:hypothetical protein